MHLAKRNLNNCFNIFENFINVNFSKIIRERTHTHIHKAPLLSAILSFAHTMWIFFINSSVGLVYFALEFIRLQIVWKNRYEYGNGQHVKQFKQYKCNVLVCMLNADTIIGCQNEVDLRNKPGWITLSASNLIHTAGM